MKTLRVWLLVLLAVLLPMRGAVAATMPCPGLGASVMTGSHLQHPGDLHEDHGAAAHHHAVAEAPGDDTAAQHGHGAGADKCNVCVSCCSLPGPLSLAPALPELALQTASFPTFSAPAPSFHSDGQERPPRTT